jgi:hypothetical protein
VVVPWRIYAQGIGLDELEHLRGVLAAINAATLAAGILDAELDR